MNILKAHKKLYQMAFSTKKFQNSLILTKLPTYNSPCFFAENGQKLTLCFYYTVLKSSLKAFSKIEDL